MAAKSRPRNRKPAAPSAIATRSYYDATREPLVCFVFLLPLVAAYELGAILLRPAADPEQSLIAASAIMHVLAWFGAAGPWIPGVALLLMLLLWHWASGRNWQIRGWVPLAMLGESIAVTPPLIVLSRLLLPPADLSAAAGVVKVQVVYTLGAAIYEEFLFRFILISLLLLILMDGFRVARKPSLVIAAVLAAGAFAACHVQPIGIKPADARWISFYAIAGGYLSLLYVTRGLGVSTGCHAVYNLAMLLWR